MVLLTPMGESVTVPMKATPAAVWALVTDVTRIGEFSPETLEGRWIAPATGPAVGARFQGHVKRNGRGPMYWTTCRVVICEPEREFAFVVEAPGSDGVSTWGYRIAAHPEGSEVTEYFRLTPSLPLKIYWLMFGRLRIHTNRRGMRQTLDRMKAALDGN